MSDTIETTIPIPLSASEFELLIDALSLLENGPMQTEQNFLGFAVGTSAEDAQAIVDQRVKDAKAEIKAKRRRIALLKAKLIQEDERLYNRAVVNDALKDVGSYRLPPSA